MRIVDTLISYEIIKSYATDPRQDPRLYYRESLFNEFGSQLASLEAVDKNGFLRIKLETVLHVVIVPLLNKCLEMSFVVKRSYA